MFKLTSITAPSALLTALTIASAPALAQERYHGRQNPNGQQSSGQSRERAQPRSEAPRQQPGTVRGEARESGSKVGLWVESGRPSAGFANGLIAAFARALILAQRGQSPEIGHLGRPARP